MKTYWHFCRDDKRLGYADGRQICKGRTLKVKGSVVMCEYGLHASKKIIDALDYAQGNIICKVILGGEIIHDTDKSVASERTVIAWANAEMTLHEFACRCAERALKRQKVKDECCVNAIRAKRDWLQGKINDEELAAARAVAWDAARVAARVVAWDAARVAARVVAWDAAWDAEKKWQNRQLTKMVKEILR